MQALLHLLGEHQALVRDQLSVALAIWFHDAIYDTTQHNNEEQSALLCEQTLQSWFCPPALIDSVTSKIRATQRHEWTDGDPDTAVFLDLDLSILAAPEAAYQRYARQIEQEYAWVPAQAYCLGRTRVLRSFLGRVPLYFTPSLRDQWELQARRNLTDELTSLADAAP